MLAHKIIWILPLTLSIFSFDNGLRKGPSFIRPLLKTTDDKGDISITNISLDNILKVSGIFEELYDIYNSTSHEA